MFSEPIIFADDNSISISSKNVNDFCAMATWFSGPKSQSVEQKFVISVPQVKFHQRKDADAPET